MGVISRESSFCCLFKSVFKILDGRRGEDSPSTGVGGRRSSPSAALRRRMAKLAAVEYPTRLMSKSQLEANDNKPIKLAVKGYNCWDAMYYKKVVCWFPHEQYGEGGMPPHPPL